MKKYIVQLDAEERVRLEQMAASASPLLIGFVTSMFYWRSTNPKPAAR